MTGGVRAWRNPVRPGEINLRLLAEAKPSAKSNGRAISGPQAPGTRKNAPKYAGAHSPSSHSCRRGRNERISHLPSRFSSVSAARPSVRQASPSVYQPLSH